MSAARVSCALCGCALTPRAENVACRRCASLHHRVCWEYGGGCSVACCGETRPLESDAAVAGGEASPTVMRRGRGADIVPISRGDRAARGGSTVYCPECHGLNPWPCSRCAFCDLPLGRLVRSREAGPRRPPQAPLLVRAIVFSDLMLAVMLALLGCFLFVATAGAAQKICGGADAGLWVQKGRGFLLAAAGLIALAAAVVATARRLESGCLWARRVHCLMCVGLVFSPSAPLAMAGGILLVCALTPTCRAYFRARSP